MLSWLAKLDPNVVVSVVVALATYAYHALLSPATQAKVADAVQSTVATALDISDRVMSALVAAAPPGTKRADLEAQLWTAARVQLAHIGLDPDKLPPAIKAAAEALVQKYLAQSSATPSTSSLANTAPILGAKGGSS